MSWKCHAALAGLGWRVVAGAAPVRVLMGCGVGLEEAILHRDFLLGGGRLLLCGGEGPLLARLHLTPLLDQWTAGEATGALGTAVFPRVHPLRGVGEVLLRIGDDCVALGGVRGEGRVCYLATADPDPGILVASLDWLRS